MHRSASGSPSFNFLLLCPNSGFASCVFVQDVILALLLFYQTFQFFFVGESVLFTLLSAGLTSMLFLLHADNSQSSRSCPCKTTACLLFLLNPLIHV